MIPDGISAANPQPQRYIFYFKDKNIILKNIYAL